MNAVKSVMLLAGFAIFAASCNTVFYSEPSREDIKSGHGTSKKESSKEQKLRNEIAQHAQKYVGAKYKYAGKSPNGFDCSGFTGYVFEKFEINLSSSSQAQSTLGKKIPLNKAQSGDLLFFGKRGKINHVALILSNSKDGIEVIHSTSSSGVMVQNVSESDYWKPRILFARSVIP